MSHLDRPAGNQRASNSTPFSKTTSKLTVEQSRTLPMLPPDEHRRNAHVYRHSCAGGGKASQGLHTMNAVYSLGIGKLFCRPIRSCDLKACVRDTYANQILPCNRQIYFCSFGLGRIFAYTDIHESSIYTARGIKHAASSKPFCVTRDERCRRSPTTALPVSPAAHLRGLALVSKPQAGFFNSHVFSIIWW